MLVVGLGNPGQKYVHTRHNIGRDVLLEIIGRGDFSDLQTDRYSHSLISNGYLKHAGDLPRDLTDTTGRLIVALPETFMNRSGEAVRELVKKYTLTHEDVVVVYDDIDLPFGRIRISKDRGDGGHNGIKSVVEHLGTKNFSRIRVGICPMNENGEKSKPHKDVVSRYVLGALSPHETEAFATAVDRVEEALYHVSMQGVEEAMNVINEG
ncbi:MAG: aminoacyl-tRNA hydrolase [Candidatus Paceibacterota bacterium]